MNYYTDVLKKYAVFTGRARRKEYWMFTLFNVIAFIVLTFLDLLLFRMNGSRLPILQDLYALAIIVPAFAVGVRRLHDTDHSGWWLLIDLVPIVGPIVLLVFLCTDGTPGGNRFGPDPKGSSAAPVNPAPQA